MKLSPDGKTVGATSRYFIKTWDVESQQIKRIISAEDARRLKGLQISPEGRKLAVHRDRWVEVRNLQTGKVELQFPQQHTGWLEEIVFSASGRWIATVGHWEPLSILDTKNPEKLQKLTSKNGPVSLHNHYQIVFSENDEYFAASGRSKDDQDWIQLWKRGGDTFDFQYAWQVPDLLNSPKPTLAFTSHTDGSTVLAASEESELHIWKLLSDGPQLLTTLDGRLSPGALQSRWSLSLCPVEKVPPKSGTGRQKHPLSIHLSQYILTSVEMDPYSAFGGSQRSNPHLGWKRTATFTILLPLNRGGKQIVILGEMKRNQLLQNFPNPFNPETWIPFRLANESHVTIYIYNTAGQLVRRLSLGTMPAGRLFFAGTRLLLGWTQSSGRTREQRCLSLHDSRRRLLRNPQNAHSKMRRLGGGRNLSTDEERNAL